MIFSPTLAKRNIISHIISIDLNKQNKEAFSFHLDALCVLIVRSKAGEAQIRANEIFIYIARAER